MFDHLLRELYPAPPTPPAPPAGFWTWRLTELLDAAFRHAHDEWHGPCLWRWEPQLTETFLSPGGPHDV